MIKTGKTRRQIKTIIDEHTYKGVRANLEFSKWSKTNVYNYLPTSYQEFIHLSRYSRWLPEEKRRETWNETISRYFNFFDEHLKEMHDYKVPKVVRDKLENGVLGLDVMPSMRCLMTLVNIEKRKYCWLQLFLCCSK